MSALYRLLQYYNRSELDVTPLVYCMEEHVYTAHANKPSNITFGIPYKFFCWHAKIAFNKLAEGMARHRHHRFLSMAKCINTESTYFINLFASHTKWLGCISFLLCDKQALAWTITKNFSFLSNQYEYKKGGNRRNYLQGVFKFLRWIRILLYEFYVKDGWISACKVWRSDFGVRTILKWFLNGRWTFGRENCWETCNSVMCSLSVGLWNLIRLSKSFRIFLWRIENVSLLLVFHPGYQWILLKMKMRTTN